MTVFKSGITQLLEFSYNHYLKLYNFQLYEHYKLSTKNMQSEHTITICMGSSCFSRGNKEILDIVKRFLAEHNLSDKVFFRGELCTTLCEKGPVIKINDELFTMVTTDTIYTILADFFDITNNV